jgi:DNA-binding MarR family transcriptional regulator
VDPESPWLTDKQQHVWRDWLEMNVQLNAALQSQMQEESSLSMQDFEVLVNLTDVPDGMLRMSELANGLRWERSRLSHHIKRMESRGLVTRQGCAEDGRGAFVVITSDGRVAIERAAPGHARLVKALVFDSLSEEELDAFAALTSKVLDRLASPAATG